MTSDTSCLELLHGKNRNSDQGLRLAPEAWTILVLNLYEPAKVRICGSLREGPAKYEIKV